MTTELLKQLRPAIVLLMLMTILTGVLYPAAVTGLAQVTFSHPANGSLIRKNGKVVGSELIGQPVSSEKYFWGRASATGPHPYNAAASSGSNLGPTNPALLEAISARVHTLRQADPQNSSPIPIDLVTSSASGLDPHVSPAAAEFQVRRVARERKLSEKSVRELVTLHTEARTFGILGEPRVNILTLNLALDGLQTP